MNGDRSIEKAGLPRQVLTESLLLASMGAAAGCRPAWRLLRFFMAAARAASYPAFLTGFRREAHEKAVDTGRAPVSAQRRSCTVRRAR